MNPGEKETTTRAWLDVHFQQLGAIHLAACALADNLGRVADVVQDRLVHGRQRAAARSELAALLAVVLQVNTQREIGQSRNEGRREVTDMLAQNGALSKENDVLAAELLLELADQSAAQHTRHELG